MEKFSMHSFRHECFIEQSRKDLDGSDQHQIAQGAGIGDCDAHSEPQPVQIAQLPVQFPQRDAVINVVRFQESVDLVTGLETR